MSIEIILLQVLGHIGQTGVSQGGITCEAIDEPGKSSKAIDKGIIINFHDKNVVIARFCDKNDIFYLYDKMS